MPAGVRKKRAIILPLVSFKLKKINSLSLSWFLTYSQMPITITTNGGKLPKNRVSTLNVIWYGWLSRAPAIKHLANQFSPANLKVRLVAQWAKWLLAFLLHVFVRRKSRLNQSMLHNASENVPDTSVWEVLVVPWIDKRGFYGETNK